jgi:hypothetical protein
MDNIERTVTVMFVGEYFALTTTVILDDALRREGEDDHALASRIASTFLGEHYGFRDVAGQSNRVGIVDEDME